MAWLLCKITPTEPQQYCCGSVGVILHDISCVCYLYHFTWLLYFFYNTFKTTHCYQPIFFSSQFEDHTLLQNHFFHLSLKTTHCYQTIFIISVWRPHIVTKPFFHLNLKTTHCYQTIFFISVWRPHIVTKPFFSSKFEDHTPAIATSNPFPICLHCPHCVWDNVYLQTLPLWV